MFSTEVIAISMALGVGGVAITYNTQLILIGFSIGSSFFKSRISVGKLPVDMKHKKSELGVYVRAVLLIMRNTSNGGDDVVI